MRRIGPNGPHQQCRDGEPRHPFERVRVVVRMGNYSAFNGYHFQSSDYSLVCCHACGTHWRTKASYVSGLPDEESP